jgi:alpha-tubulin suppressor-like RCC1 family protein
MVAWGQNFSGQLGNNSTTDSSVPVLVNQSGVLSGKSVVAISADEIHSLALCLDGTIAAWGWNSSGQLGNGSTTKSSIPVLVTQSGVLSGKTVVAVSAGAYHSLAVASYANPSNLSNLSMSAGSIQPQFDPDTTVYSADVSFAVSTITVTPTARFTTNVVRLNDSVVTSGSSSQSISLAVGVNSITVQVTAPDGITTKTYRINVTRQPASSIATLSSLVPSIGTLSPTFTSSSTSYSYSVANTTNSITLRPTVTDTAATIKVNGIPVASGSKSLEIPLAGGDNTILVLVTAQDGITNKLYTISFTRPRLALEASFISSSGIPLIVESFTAAGNDVQLSLGFAPPTGTNLTVVKNTGLSFIGGQFSNLAQGQAVNLSFGGKSYRFVANYYGGSGNDLVLEWPYRDLAAWGSNNDGQLGNNSTTASSVPVLVNQSGVLAGKTVVAVSANYQTSLALCSDGTIVEWGYNSSAPVGVTQSGVLSGKTVVAVSAGNGHRLALCSDGTIAAWGFNSGGRLGNNSPEFYSSDPVLVDQTGVLAGKFVVAVSAGSSHSLALCTDGTIVAWGQNFNGRLGNNSTTDSSVPVLVTQSGVLSGKTVVAISAHESSLALCTDGTIAAWGSNSVGQLGNNSTTNSSVPVLVTQSGVLSGKTVVAVSAGGGHNLALCTDGTIAAWGSNQRGRLGNNSYSDSRVPVLVTQSGVLSGKTVVAVSASEYFSLALCSDGTIAAWGLNSGLGNNSYSDSRVPVLVDQSGVLAGKTAVAFSAGSQHGLGVASYENTPDLSNLSLSAGGIQPQFDPDTTVYNVDVSFAVSSITVTPTAAVTTNVILLNNSVVTSGNRSQLISLAVGVNSIKVQVTAPDGITTKTYTINVTRQPASSTATLQGLLPSSGVLSPTFTSSSTSYSSSVPNATTAITLRPTAADTTASIKVNGSAVNSGNNSQSIPLSVGPNTMTVLVVAEDGITNKTYTLTVTRAPSAVSTLSALTLSSGTLSPGFASGTTSYATSVTNATTSITLRPTVTDASAEIKVNGVSVTSGSNSQPIALAVGTNPITVLVTAQDGTTQSVYTVTVTRPPSAVSTLSDLVLNSGILSPGFRSGTTNYDASVLSSVKSVQVTPTVTDSTASVKVNGLAVTSGASSSPISLSVGNNPIQVVVTAQDGNTISNYTLTVFVPSAVATLSGLTCNSGSLSPAFTSGTTAYAVNVANDCTGVTLTPTVTEPNATVRVNGNVVGSGTASMKIPVLASGSNVINLAVTAQDGTTIQTYAVTVNRPPLNGNFASATTVPLSVSSYDASGNFANLSLGYAPAPGTTLTLVKLTGLSFIQGRFTNLTQGQYVSLVYQGVVYRFVVNYYGGTGNDLVLQWANDQTYAWGANSYGQLGNNGTSNSSLPTSVLSSGALSGKCVVAVAAGSFHSLALCADGTLAAWGRNDLGQLGNNSTTSSSVPVAITNSGALSGKTVVAISAGYYHNLALCSDGTVVAWGQNTYGQLGDGSKTNRSVPIAVSSAGGLSGKTVRGIAAGYYHNLAQCTDGSLVAWGRNTYGQLGNNSTTDSSTPVDITHSGVLNGLTVAQFAAGSDHSLVLCTDGSLAAWGRNNYGQLGEGSGANSSVPVEVDSTDVLAGKIVTSISAGGWHNLALCSDGTLAAFGRNTSGQLGDGGTTNSGLPMVANLSGLSGKAIAAVQAANGHSLALCADGSIYAWGSSSNGQLGNGGTTSSSLPVVVTTSPFGSGERFMTLATGTSASHSMALVAIPPTNTGFSVWAAGHAGLSDSTAMGDPDKDGIPNVLEYVLNGNPAVASTAPLPVVSENASSFEFSFSRAVASAADTTQVFQYSTDLNQWTELSLTQPTDARVTLGAEDSTGIQPVTVTIPKQGDMPMFGRLKVTQQ